MSQSPRPQESLILPERGWAISRSRAAAVAIACWAGFALVAALVLGGQTGPFDRAGLLLFRHADLSPLGPPGLVEAVRDWTALGGTLLRNLFTLIAIAALLFLRLRREASLLALTIVGGWIANSLVKGLVGRPRPTIVPHLTDAGGFSFPSGHSFNSAVVYIAIGLALATLASRRPVRWSIIALACAVSALVALSRVWLGVHYPSDVIAGWLGGAGWAFAGSALLQRPARLAADAAAPAIEAATPGEIVS